MPKCMYWLGTRRITNQILTNGLHSIFNTHVYGGLDTRVTDASLKASLNFVARRYVRGLAVLSTSVQEELWTTCEETAVGHADDLRKTPGNHQDTRPHLEHYFHVLCGSGLSANSQRGQPTETGSNDDPWISPTLCRLRSGPLYG